MGWIALASWILLSIIFIVFGRMCEQEALTATGAIMILMVAMVSAVAY